MSKVLVIIKINVPSAEEAAGSVVSAIKVDLSSICGVSYPIIRADISPVIDRIDNSRHSSPRTRENAVVRLALACGPQHLLVVGPSVAEMDQHSSKSGRHAILLQSAKHRSSGNPDATAAKKTSAMTPKGTSLLQAASITQARAPPTPVAN